MMSKSKEAPAIRLSKPLAIFDGDVNSVVLTVEISSSRWFCTRPVWERRLKDACEFFNNDCSFGELTSFQICFNVFPFNVDVVIFGEVCFPIVEAVGRQRSADKHPSPKCLGIWELQFAVR